MEAAGDGRGTGLESQLPWVAAQEGSRLADFTRCLDQPRASLSLKRSCLPSRQAVCHLLGFANTRVVEA